MSSLNFRDVAQTICRGIQKGSSEKHDRHGKVMTTNEKIVRNSKLQIVAF